MKLTFEIDTVGLDRYSDEFLAFAWHAAQQNPAPHGDHEAGELVEKIGREIIRRWIKGVEPELWHHQGRDYFWSKLTDLALYVPPERAENGTPEWHNGEWVVRSEVLG